MLALQLNCLSEVLFDSALRRASQLDSYIATYGKPVGPLHGLPGSLKDPFRVEGAETSVGFVGWLGKRETGETESEVVKMAMEMGAVVHVKTNVPTGLMVWRSAALELYDARSIYGRGEWRSLDWCASSASGLRFADQMRSTRRSRRTTISLAILGTRTIAIFLLGALLAVRLSAASMTILVTLYPLRPLSNQRLLTKSTSIGEASLIAMRGSLLGLGTDIGVQTQIHIKTYKVDLYL